MLNKLKVLFVSAEIAPIAKVGGLADVVASLPQALQELGIEVTVALPYYSFLKNNKQLAAKRILSFNVEFSSKQEKVVVYRGVLPGSETELYLFDYPCLSPIETSGQKIMSGQLYVSPLVDLERFVFFSMAVAESIGKLPIKFNVLHCHDWHTGLVPYLTRHDRINALFTIHNLANQGVIDNLLVKWLGDKVSDLPKTNNQYNLMSIGLQYSAKINAVSPNYAQEILTKNYGCGLEGVLRQEKDKLSGIVNGIDTKLFNPETDTNIAKNFNVANLQDKIVNKKALQLTVGLAVSEKIPVLGLVSRFVSQKGLDLITEKIIKLPAQFIFLGEGDPVIEENLHILANKFANIQVIKGFDLRLAQQIYAGADFFLMPSRFEPCGLGQLIAMRYGALPIVCSVGGLKDTVNSLNGFSFATKTANVLHKTIKLALTEFYAQPKLLEAKKRRAMKGDYSWSKSAKKYQKIYQKIANIK